MVFHQTWREVLVDFRMDMFTGYRNTQVHRLVVIVVYNKIVLIIMIFAVFACF